MHNAPPPPDPNVTQLHSVAYGQWMVYSGIGTGRQYDTYAARSAYALALQRMYAL